MTLAKMRDSTTPLAIPTDTEYIAIYANGKYAANYDEIQRHFPWARILDIDVLGTAPGAGACDVERGDMSPQDVPGWVARRLELHPNGVLCRVYCNQSTWPAVKAEVSRLGSAQRAAVRYWIADPTGQPHMVPGADATQYGWWENWDSSMVDVERFFPS